MLTQINIHNLQLILRLVSIATRFSLHISDAPTDLVDDIIVRQSAELGGGREEAAARNHRQGHHFEAPLHLEEVLSYSIERKT